MTWPLMVLAVVLSTDPAASCRTDDDCTLARDCGCDCCPSPIRPMTKQQAKAIRENCARLGPCGRDPLMCKGQKCEADRWGAATCEAGVCVRAPAAAKADAGVR